jgi:hypothetical protein
MIFRSLYDLTHGLGFNPLDKTLAAESLQPGKPSWKARTIQALLVFLFDFCTSISVICGVGTWRMNDVKFADKRFYQVELGSTQEGELDGKLPKDWEGGSGAAPLRNC